MEDNRTMKDLAEEALRVQVACNLSGVVHGYARALSRLWRLLDAEGKASTDRVNQHPIAVLWASKVESLTALDYVTADNAFRWARELTTRTLEDEARDSRRCLHCGAPYNQHRGGHDGEPSAVRRKCPPVDAFGHALPQPKLTKLGDAEADQALAAYWRAETVFEALPGQARASEAA